MEIEYKKNRDLSDYDQSVEIFDNTQENDKFFENNNPINLSVPKFSVEKHDPNHDPLSIKHRLISNRMNTYQQKYYDQELTPMRIDPFSTPHLKEIQNISNIELEEKKYKTNYA